MTTNVQRPVGQSAVSSSELAEIEDAFHRREKQLPVLSIFLVVVAATSLYHLLVGF